MRQPPRKHDGRHPEVAPVLLHEHVGGDLRRAEEAVHRRVDPHRLVDALRVARGRRSPSASRARRARARSARRRRPCSSTGRRTGASGACRRAASSRLSVPTALTSKSSNGIAAPRGRATAARRSGRSGRAAPRATRPRDRRRGRGCRARGASKRRASRAQPLEVPGRVAVLAEEVAAHVVVDAVHAPAALVEERDDLRADQAARAGDEGRLARGEPDERSGGAARARSGQGHGTGLTPVMAAAAPSAAASADRDAVHRSG